MRTAISGSCPNCGDAFQVARGHGLPPAPIVCAECGATLRVYKDGRVETAADIYKRTPPEERPYRRTRRHPPQPPSWLQGLVASLSPEAVDELVAILDTVTGREREPLPPPLPAGVAIGALVPLDQVELAHIKAVVARCNGVRNLAASILAIGERTLYRKLDRIEERKA